MRVRSFSFGLIFFAFLFIFTGLVSSCGIQNENKKQEADAKSKSELEFKYLYAEAGKAYMFGNLKQASQLYTAAIQANPTSAASNYYLAKVYLEKNEIQSAYNFAGKAINLNPNNLWYSLLYSDIAVAIERFGDAQNALSAQLKLNSNNELVYSRLCNLYQILNDLPRLLETFSDMQKRFGFENDRALQIFDIYMSSGDFPSAEQTARDLISANPDDLKFQALLAEFYIQSFRKEDAKKLYANLLKKSGDDAIFRLSYAMYADSERDTAGFLESCNIVVNSSDVRIEDKLKLLVQGYENSALISDEQYEAFLNQLLEQQPDSYLPNLYYADFLLSEGEDADALSNYRIASKSDPSDFNLAVSVFELEYELSDFESLYDDASFFSEIYPNQAKIFLYKGIAALMTKRFKEAEEALRYGSDLAFDDAQLAEQFNSYLAENYSLTGKYDLADRYFEKVLSMNPLNCSVSASYARCLAYRKTSLTKAEQLTSTCKDSYPENATFLATWALILLQKGELEKAQQTVKKAFSIQPENIHVLEIYGDIVFHTGETDTAVSFWQKSKTNGNISPVIERKISQKTFLSK